mgnify:CR=1 FL=1
MNIFNAKACGLLFCYNEEQILDETIRHYLGEGIDLVVFDNCSTDGSPEIARRLQEQGGFPGHLLDIVSVRTEGYEWGRILRTACDYMHANLSHYRWLMTIDADSFYFSPVKGMPLTGFISACGAAGYNIIGGNLYEFYPTEKDDPSDASTVERMRYCKVMPWEERVVQQKIFRYHPSVDFYSQFAHQVIRDDPRPGPVRFIYNHYPWISYKHGLKKIFKERKPRYVERRQNPANHMHYLDLLPERNDLVRSSSGLHFFRLDEVQLPRAKFISELATDRTAGVRQKTGDAARRAGSAAGRFSRNYRQDRRGALKKAAARVGERIPGLRPLRAPSQPPVAPAGGTGESAAPAECIPASPAARPEPPQKDLTISWDEIQRQSARVTGFPETYHFLMTNFCNARCLFCNQKIVHEGHKEITLDSFKKMVSHIPVESARIFYLSGGGDPLLCRDIIPIIDYVNAEFPWIEIRLRTNGLLLGRRAADLARTNIRLEISVHGATEETNNNVLQLKNTNVIFAGLEQLNRQLEANGRQMMKLFVPAVSMLNINEVPDLIRKAAKLTVDEVEIYFCRFYDSPAAGGAPALDPGQSLFYHQGLYNRTVAECQELADSLGVVFRYEALFGDGPRAAFCSDPWRNIVIDWEGDIFPCCGGEVWFYDKVKSGEYRFGNLFEEEIFELLNNETYVKIRRTLSPNYGDDLIPECTNCHNSLTFTGPDVLEGHVISHATLSGSRSEDSPRRLDSPST